MIDIPVVDSPDVLNRLLLEFRPLFGRRQFRQFCRYIVSGIASSTRSSAHLNGIFVEHTNQSNLNRFLRNIPADGIFNISCSLINRNCTAPVLALDDTILQRNGKHIDGAQWIYDHSQGKTVYGMQYTTSVISGNEGIFPLSMELKTDDSKIDLQINTIKKAMGAGLRFSTVVFDSWYFSSKLVKFLESMGKDYVSEAKSNRTVCIDGKWIRLRDYANTLDLKSMKSYTVNGKTYFMKAITTRMKNAGIVKVIVSRRINSLKFFVTNRTDWKVKTIIGKYLRRWDIEVFHEELKQDGLKHLYQRKHATLLGTAKMSLLGELLLEISAINSMGNHLKIRKGTPEPRHKQVAISILTDLFKAIENKGRSFLDAILKSIEEPYRSTRNIYGGAINS